ncbi:TPA: SGNH/GDSL hydrolase family protein [Bacillus cereus]
MNKKKIVIFGDSLVCGMGVKQGECYGEILGKIYKSEILLKGMPGATIKDGLTRFNSVRAENSKCIILAFGLNDVQVRMPFEKIMSKLPIRFSKITRATRKWYLSTFRGYTKVTIDKYVLLLLELIKVIRRECGMRTDILLCTPTPINEFLFPGTMENLREIQKSIVGIGIKYDVQVIDIFRVLSEHKIDDILLEDGKHLNSYGHKIVAGYICSYLDEWE